MRKLDPVKHGEKRREILDAAGRCFTRDGFRGATIADICTEAGISHGHLYHYFASKEEIVRALSEAGLDYAAERLSQITHGVDPVTTLFAEMERVKSYRGPGSPLLILDMFAEAGRNPAMSALLIEQSRRIRALLANFLREGQAHGQIDPALDPDLAATVLISMLDGARTMAIRDPAIDLHQAMELLQTQIRRFLMPHTSSLQ